ncbi:hypothetical protein MTO96_009935 [Rhipicephalus appendiculatus]
MSELHAHVAPLLQPFTTGYAKRCEKIVWSNVSAPMMSPNSPACRRLPALKRIFHCGLSFSRILEEMELVHQKAEVLCPLLKKYETCVPDSASELGCKDDPVMKGHEFWAGVERARKLRSQHRYESGSPELVQDLSSKRASKDFARPGAYFIDQLSNPPDYNSDNHARKKLEAEDSNSNFESQQIPENFRNSPLNLPLYKSIRNVPHAARQGETDAEGWRGVPPLSREEELEMYEDTRGMAELLQKQRERHYSRYKGRDNLAPKSDMQRAWKDPVHRYGVTNNEMLKGGLDNDKGFFNRSLAYYDHNGGTDTRRFRGEYGMRHIQRYPYIRHYALNEMAGKGEQDERRQNGVPLDRRVIGLHRRGHAYRSTNYDLSEYEKPSLGHLPHIEGEEELVPRGAMSFPEDDAPVLPKDESLDQGLHQVGHHRAFSMRRTGSKVYPDTPRNLQVAAGMEDMNYAPGVAFSSDSVLGAKLPRRDGADALTGEQISQNHRQGAPLPYYPRRLASNMFRARAGLPTDPRSAVGILQEDYDRGVGDYNKASQKMSDGPSVLAKEEMSPRLNAMKRLSGHDPVSSPNNPNFQLPGEASGNVRSFQRKLPFKKNSYKEAEPHEMNSYPDELRPFPSPSQRRSNDSNYVGPNSFLPEPGLRSPKEKVVPDFLGERQERAGSPEARTRKDESSDRRSLNSPETHIRGLESEGDYNDGRRKSRRGLRAGRRERSEAIF